MFLMYIKNIECLWKKQTSKNICLKKIQSCFFKLLNVYIKNIRGLSKKCTMCMEKVNTKKYVFKMLITYFKNIKCVCVYKHYSWFIQKMQKGKKENL